MALPTKRTSTSRLPHAFSYEARKYGFYTDPDRDQFNENMRYVKYAVTDIVNLEDKTRRERKKFCDEAFDALRQARLYIQREGEPEIRSMAAKELADARRQVGGLCRRGKGK